MGYWADNAGQDYCTVAPWPTDWGWPFVDAMINLDNQTDMYDTYSSTCGAQVDIYGVRYNNAYMPGVRGSYQCEVFINSTTCDQGRLKVNVDLLTDYTQRRKTFCHEVGHSVGLQHQAAGDYTYSDCMISGTVTGEQWFIEHSQHHRDHVNVAY